MKNFKVTDKETNKEYWISRSVAVAIILYTIINDKVYILVEKRGKGCPDFVGSYCLPCGYVDWDETLREAAKREVYEETGYVITNINELHMVSIQDNPKDNIRQNITVRYAVKIPTINLIQSLISGVINTNTMERGGEPNEVDCFTLVDIEKIDQYEFAWNHNEVIKEWYKQFI